MHARQIVALDTASKGPCSKAFCSVIFLTLPIQKKGRPTFFGSLSCFRSCLSERRVKERETAPITFFLPASLLDGDKRRSLAIRAFGERKSSLCRTINLVSRFFLLFFTFFLRSPLIVVYSHFGFISPSFSHVSSRRNFPL